MTSGTHFFTVGGSLPADSPSYVARKADRQLLECLRQGRLAYVLDTRQVGKSSLMVRAAQGLRSEGRRVALLDLSGYGNIVTPEQWFFGLLYSMAEQLGLADAVEQHWLDHGDLGLAQRWTHAIREVVLAIGDDPLVVFIDEIDAVASLPFSVDSFFAAIRECHNRRAHDPVFERLTFCLLGVATPSDLIRDPRTTPFNVAQRMELTDFTREEAAPLAAGLGSGANAIAALDRVLYWTGGHPYLTQRLCRAVAEAGNGISRAAVDRACDRVFLSRQARATDDNLRFASARLLAGDPRTDLASILTLYDLARSRAAGVEAKAGDVRADVLLLSGLVRAQEGRLVVRNRIYAEAFDHRWVQANMPGEEVRRQRRALVRGYTRASLVWLVIALLAIVSLMQTRHATQSDREAARQIMLRQTLENDARRLRSENDLKRAAQQRMSADLGRMADQLAADRRKVAMMNASLAQMGARLRDGRIRMAAIEARGRRANEYIDSMSGQIASAFAVRPETGYEALQYGLRAVEPALRDHRDPSLKAANGLIEAVNRDVFRRFVLEHDSSVTSLCFSPDGARLLTAGKGRYALIWSTATGALLQRLEVQGKTGRNQQVNATEYSADGRRILIASDQAGVSVWDATKSGAVQTKPLIALPRTGVPVECAAISPDGSSLALAAPKNNVTIYDVASRSSHPLTTSTGDMHRNYLWSIAYSHSGRLLVTASEDGTVKVWDAVSGALKTTYDGHATHELREYGVLSAVFDHSDDLVASAGKDGVVRIWWWRTNQLYKRLAGHVDWVWSVDVSPFDFYVATAGRDRRVLVWGFGGNQRPLHSLNAHGGQVYSARFNHNGDLLATASEDHSVSVWQIASMDVTTGAAMTYATFSHDGRSFVLVSDDGYARLHGPVPGRGGSLICDASIRGAAFSPDDRELATCDTDGLVKIWSADVQPGEHRAYLRQLEGPGGPLLSVDYSPDGKRLVSAGLWGGITVWDVPTGRKLWQLSGQSGAVASICYSADGAHLLCANADGSAELRNAENGAVTRRFLPPGRQASVASAGAERPYDAAFLPDGRHIATADGDGHVYAFDMTSGKLVGTLAAHRGEVLSLAFNRAGDRLATAGADGRVYVWRVADLLGRRPGGGAKPEPLLQVSRHVDRVVSVRFSPDGQKLVTASRDNTSIVCPATIEGYVARARDILAQRPPIGGAGSRGRLHALRSVRRGARHGTATLRRPS